MIAFEYPISQAMNIKIEEAAGIKTVVIEFRYAEYRLKLDDPEKATLLISSLLEAMKAKPLPKEKTSRPRLYSDRGG